MNNIPRFPRISQIPGYAWLASHRHDRRKVFSLALPAIANQISFTLVQVVDTVFIGRLGTTALGASALVGTLIWSIMVLGDGFSVGLTACVARSVGAGDYREAGTFYKTGVLSVVLLGAAVSLPLALSYQGIAAVIRMPLDMVSTGGDYFIPFVLFIPAIYANISLQAAFRAAGDAKTPMIAGIATNVINIVLDYLLIFGAAGFPEMGITGAAIASGISFVFGSLFMILVSLSRQWGKPGTGSWFSASHLLRCTRIAVPAAVERGSMSVSQLLIMSISVNYLGSAAVAAFQVTMRLASLSFMPGFGFSIAASALVGQSLGEKRIDRARKYTWHAAAYAAAVIMTISILYYVIPSRLIALFTTDPAVIAQTILPLRIYSLTALFLSMAMVFGGAVRGAGETLFPMKLMIVTRFGIRLLLSVVLSNIFRLGLTGVWIAMCSDFVIRGIVLMFYFRSGRWEKVIV